MEKRFFRLAHPQARKLAAECCMSAPDGWVVKISEPTRNLSQNCAMWPILEAFADQLDWPVNGKLVTLTAEEFKDILTAAFNNETVRLAMGLNGGVVMLGCRTSEMGKAKFSDWLEFLHATAADRGVKVYAD